MLPPLYRYFNLLKCKQATFNYRFARCFHLDICKYANASGGIVMESGGGSQFKRPKRSEPPKVKHGLIPIEWFDYFMPKTGVTGFYTFLFTTFTYVASKEILVMEHNFYNGLSMLVVCTVAVKYTGKAVAAQLDKGVDEYENKLSEGRRNRKQMNEAGIAHEEKLQWMSEGQTMLVEAKRENVHLQREVEYRKRLMRVYNEVKKRLDCQIEMGKVEGRMVHKNIVSYVINEVHKSLTPEFLNQYMDRCIEDFAVIVKRSK